MAVKWKWIFGFQACSSSFSFVPSSIVNIQVRRRFIESTRILLLHNLICKLKFNDAIHTLSLYWLLFAGRRYQILSQNQQERQRSSEQLERVFAEWARLRLQKQIHHQNQLNQQKHHQRPPLSSLNYPQEIIGPGFSFLYPAVVNTKNSEDAPQNIPNEPYEFAVQPFDSRYYSPSDQSSDNIDEIAARYENADYNIDPNSMTGDVFSNSNNNNDDSLIPPPMHVHGENKQQQTDRILHRNQLKQKNVQQQDVMQKPLQVDFDGTMSLYIVALIAGLSCAFSTGVSWRH